MTPFAPMAMLKRMRGRRAAALLLVMAGACFLGALFLPIWRITLDAPQYPEGMGMFIWATTLTGLNPHDLDIINQLNHYIGMQAIVPDAIPELKIMGPLIGVFGLLCFAAAIRPRVTVLVLLLGGLTCVGALGLYDFWRWEYDYGHNLDPRAAIRIPGMSYQPPLIGTAKLLNFTSTSWPASGGILLFAAGGLVGLALLLVWKESRNPSAAKERMPSALARSGCAPVSHAARPRGLKSVGLMAAAALIASGCRSEGPSPVEWGVDACHHCKMALVQKGFVAQRVNGHGKVFQFDAVECLIEDLKSRPTGAEEKLFVSDWSRPEAPLFPARRAAFLLSKSISSPMGGNLAGFAEEDSARLYQARLGGEMLSWRDLLAP